MGEMDREVDAQRVLTESLTGMKSELLVGRYRDGNARALEVLFARYSGRIERIVYARTGALLRSREEVADLVQETLMRMLNDLDRYEVREDARFIDWAATVCERTLRNRARYHAADRRDVRMERALPGPSTDSTSGAGWDPAGREPQPFESLSAAERSQLIDDCVGQLPDDYREVILLREYAGASWDLVAVMLDRGSKGAVQQLYQRARKVLAESLSRHRAE